MGLTRPAVVWSCWASNRSPCGVQHEGVLWELYHLWRPGRCLAHELCRVSQRTGCGGPSGYRWVCEGCTGWQGPADYIGHMKLLSFGPLHEVCSFQLNSADSDGPWQLSPWLVCAQSGRCGSLSHKLLAMEGHHGTPILWVTPCPRLRPRSPCPRHTHRYG